MTRFHLPHGIGVRLHVLKTDVVIHTRERVGSVGVCQFLSVGLSMQEEAVDVD